jgi:hypothetical protein
MSVMEGPQVAGLVDRVKNILFKPNTEWDRIEAEPATVKGLYFGYVMPLAAIPAVCSLIGTTLFGVNFVLTTVRLPLTAAITIAVTGYVGSLVGVCVVALALHLLAERFGGRKDLVQAFKVAAYSWTPAWLAGVLLLLPGVGLMGAMFLISLYGFYLLWAGAPKLMKTPKDQSAIYVIAAVITAIVVQVLVTNVTNRLYTPGPTFGAGGSVSLPGGGQVDLGKLQAASKSVEAAAQGVQAGVPAATTDSSVTPVSTEILSGLLPGSVSGYGRGDVESESGGTAGLNASNAQAAYTRGEDTFTLAVTDMGAAAGLAQMAGAVEMNRTERNGAYYSKVGKVNGRATFEEFDRDARQGKFGVLVADRFMVQAEGRADSIEVLKAAVGSIDLGRLESLARKG